MESKSKTENSSYKPPVYTEHPGWRWVPFLNYPTQTELEEHKKKFDQDQQKADQVVPLDTVTPPLTPSPKANVSSDSNPKPMTWASRVGTHSEPAPKIKVISAPSTDGRKLKKETPVR